MKYHSSENRKCYFPPLLSNGSIAFAVNEQGTIGYRAADYREKGVRAFDGIVVRAGRRSPLCNSLYARLFPLGEFMFEEGSNTETWWQNLEVEKVILKAAAFMKAARKSIPKASFIPT